jgi:hypothetical protein
LFIHPLFCQFIDFLVHPSIVSHSISLLAHGIYLLVSPSTRLSVHLFVHSSSHSSILHMFIFTHSSICCYSS